MKNYKMIISYDGTRYNGWQRQVKQDTIQGRIENVLSKMCGQDIEIIGAGRTDAGVHAKGMVANAAFETNKNADEICDYLNKYLPEDISVIEVKEASDRFHARYNAVGKTYVYTVYIGRNKPVFDRKYLYWLDKKVDIKAMTQAADVMCGEHDFRNFCGNLKIKKSTVRNVDRINIRQDRGYIYFEFHGNGFLQNMVRLMVGTLLEVGYGKRTIEDVEKSLRCVEIKKSGFAVPPQGLCLISVDY